MFVNCFQCQLFMCDEPRCQKTGLRGFQPGPTQTGLFSHWRWLEAWNFGFRKQRDCTIQVAKTKALISFAVTAKLICVFVFAYAKIRFSDVAAHMRCQLTITILTLQIDHSHVQIRNCILIYKPKLLPRSTAIILSFSSYWDCHYFM